MSLTSTAFFALAIAWLRKVEGGFFNDPRGGPTYAGVRQAYFDHWLIGLDSAPMRVTELVDRPELYEAYFLTQYWLPMQMYDLLPSAAAALVIFDGAVLHGKATMTRLLQQVLGVAVDDHLGPTSLHQYHSSIDSAGQKAITTELITRRRQFIVSLNDPQMGPGWLNRLSQLSTQCETLW